MAHTYGTDVLLERFKTMTLAELHDFIKAFEDTFDVTATPPTLITADTPAPGAPDEEPQYEFTVVLTAAGTAKIQVIKTVREITKLGLKEAKDAVDAAPFTVAEGVDAAAAETIRAKLAAAGAEVTVR